MTLPEPIPTVTSRERLLACLAAFVGVPAITLALCGVGLLDRPFWSDEALSWLISQDADAGHGMAALAGGVDTNAPLIHLLFHHVGNAFGHTPAVYRSASAMIMSVALVGLYFTLRLTFRRGPAVVGCLAFWALPIVITHQTETRFYGPLLAATIWTAFLLARRREKTSPASTIGLSFASIALCATHYFGILILIAFTFGELLRARRRAIEQLFPSACGVTTTLCFWPLLRTQRATVAGLGTWVPDDFVTNLRTTLAMLLPTVPLIAFLALTFLAIAVVGRRRIASGTSLAITSPLASLVFFVLAIIAFDRLVQPVLVPRYLIPALPLVALLLAGIASALSKRGVWIGIGALSVLVLSSLLEVRSKLANPQPRAALAVVRSVEHVPAGVPVLVDSRSYVFSLWAARPDLRGRMMFVDDRRNAHPDLDRSFDYEARMVRVNRDFYGWPNQMPLDAMMRLDRFVLVTDFPETLDTRFAGWDRRSIGGLTFELTRSTVADAR